MIYHVGIHKTGTTAFQELLVPTLNHGLRNPSYEDLTDIFVPKSPFDIEPGEKCRERFSGLLNQFGPRGVVSCERLWGSPLAGNTDIASISARIKSLDPDAKIIITIRDQTEFIESYYRQYIRMGGKSKIKDFLFHEGNVEPGFDLAMLFFDRLYDFYCKHFGLSNVLLVSYQVIRGDMEKYLGIVTKFCYGENEITASKLKTPLAVRRNVSFSYLSTCLIRLGNKITMGNRLYAAREMMPWMARRIREICRVLDFCGLRLNKRKFLTEKMTRQLILKYQGSNNRLEAIARNNGNVHLA